MSEEKFYTEIKDRLSATKPKLRGAEIEKIKAEFEIKVRAIADELDARDYGEHVEGIIGIHHDKL